MKATPLEMARFISQLPIFQYASEEDARVFATYLESITIEEGQYLFKEGQKATGMYFVQNGRLQVIKGAETDNPTTLTFFNRGAIVGEMSLINGHTRSASVVAIWKADLLLLSTEAFKRMEVERPDLSVCLLKGLIRILSDRIREMNADMVRSY